MLRGPLKTNPSTPVKSVSFAGVTRASGDENSAAIAASATVSPSRTPLTEAQRYACGILSAVGYKNNEICTAIPCSPQSVIKWKRRLSQTGAVDDSPRSGRPRLISAELQSQVVKHALHTKFTTPKQIKRELHLSVSPRTIRRSLNEQGVYGRVARVTPPLKPIHAKRRLSFSEGYSNWDNDRWATVLWSDETSIWMGTHGRVWVQRRKNTAREPENTIPRQKHPPKVHMWGCFCSGGVGGCEVFEDNLESKGMKAILQKHLLASSEKEDRAQKSEGQRGTYIGVKD